MKRRDPKNANFSSVIELPIPTFFANILRGSVSEAQNIFWDGL